DIISGVLGPILGMVPTMDPISGKIESLNKVMASPDYQENTQNLQQLWGQLTKNHPTFAKAVTNSLSLANNMLQVYGAGKGVIDTASLAKGFIDSSSEP